jgi:dienelactone hydrolase
MQTFDRAVDGYHDVGYQFTLDLRRRAQMHFERQRAEKAALTTIEAFESHRERVRAHFLNVIGGLPGPQEYSRRSPLNARVTGKVERADFLVEKLIYESLPNYPVTAACYRPKVLDAPAPAVVMVHGHSDQGKSYPVYQAVCLDLVCDGFIVLAIDPIGQGERHELRPDGVRLQNSCTREHTQAGQPFWLRGASIARHFIWDVMRGLDYLETREDVDVSRIGITGNSGGGTQTCYLMMCEPRLAAAVPCTFPMTLESYQKTGQPQDAEQIIPGCIVHGPDHDDFLTALAPKPVLVGAAAYDFFPIEGTHEAVRRAQQIYALYGKEENVALAVAPTTHQYAPQLRQACVNWFKQHLRGEAPDFVTGTPQPFAEEELWATRSGQIYRDDPAALTALQLNQRELPAPSSYASPDEQRRALASTLGIEAAGDRSTPIFPRIISDSVVDGYRTEKIFFFSVPDIVVTGVLVHPPNMPDDAPLPATLLLLENGTNDIPASRPRIEALLRQGHRVFVFDVRGVGALTEYAVWPGCEHETFNPEFKLGCDAMMLGLSTLGLRVFDVLRGTDYLRSRADVSQVHLRGVRSGAVFAFFAAVLETGIASLTCEERLTSYRELCQTPDYQSSLFGLKVMAWELLKTGDFDDYLPALAPRPATFLRNRNARGEIVAE